MLLHKGNALCAIQFKKEGRTSVRPSKRIAVCISKVKKDYDWLASSSVLVPPMRVPLF